MSKQKKIALGFSWGGPPEPLKPRRRKFRPAKHNKVDSGSKVWPYTPVALPSRHDDSLISHNALRIRAAYDKLVKDVEPRIFLTVSFGHRIKPEVAQERIRDLFNRMQRKALGGRWSKRPADQRPSAIGFLERESSNVHYHISIAASDRVCMAFLHNGSEKWKDLVPRGHYHAVVIKDTDGQRSYCSKRQITMKAFETCFIYVPEPK